MDESHSRFHHEHRSMVDGAGAVRVVAISSALLGLVAVGELAAASITGSAAILADGFHNLGDVAATGSLAIAFVLSRRAPTRRFPYGYHRGEDLAGLFVVVLILMSAVAAGTASWQHLRHHDPLKNPALAFGLAMVGFLGNELMAGYKVRAGRRLHSVALVADGRHSRIDGLASLTAAAGVGGTALGFASLDAAAGVVITGLIVGVAWHTTRHVAGRLLDEADLPLLNSMREVAESTPGVVSVREARARWIGRQVMAELTLELPGDCSLSDAHALGESVRHRLYDRIEPLADVIIHLDPAGEPDAHCQLVARRGS